MFYRSCRYRGEALSGATLLQVVDHWPEDFALFFAITTAAWLSWESDWTG
jgi:hypothetical protein